jgi:ribosomal protein L2
MGQKKIRPVTPGMRGQVTTDFKEITKKKPEKSLLESKNLLVEETIKVGSRLDIKVVVTNKNTEL